MSDSVSAEEFERYKSEIYKTLLDLAGEIEKLKKEIATLRSRVGNRR